MSCLFRLIGYSIVDFFVQQAEGCRYRRDEFLKYTPYLLCNGKLNRFFADFPEKKEGIGAYLLQDGHDSTSVTACAASV